MRVNYDSDFKILERNVNGNDRAPFKFTYTTDGSTEVIATFDGTTYTNCERMPNGDVLVYVPAKSMPVGEITARREYLLDDPAFPDGINNHVTTRETGIRVVYGITDDTTATTLVFPTYQQGPKGDPMTWDKMTSEQKEELIADASSAVADGAAVELISGGYIATNGTTVNVGAVAPSADHAYAVRSAKEGSSYIVSGLGGATPRLYCFIDASGKVLERADINKSSTKQIIIAPYGTDKVVFNVVTNSGTSMSGYVDPYITDYTDGFSRFSKSSDILNDVNSRFTASPIANGRIKELYVTDDSFAKFKVLYLFYQPVEQRYVFQVVGSNDDFATQTNVVYLTFDNIENNTVMLINRLASAGGGMFGYVIFENMTTAATSGIGNAIITDKAFDRENNAIIDSYLTTRNLSINALNSPQKLIGALYFGGWQGKSNYTLANDSLFPNSTLPDKAGYTDWREYAKAKDAELIDKDAYPPSDCSFSMFYPEQALESYPSRKPMLGWVISTVQQMEQQIEFAYKSGIDYFEFCYYMPSNGSGLKPNGDIDIDGLSNNPYNRCVYDFLEANNSYKMKMCIMLCNHGNRLTEKTMFQMMEYFKTEFFDNPRYLYMNGRPVFSMFDANFTNLVKPFHKVMGCIFLRNGNSAIKGGIDGRMSYAGAIPSEAGLYPYSKMADANTKAIADYYEARPTYLDVPTASAGRDEFPRADFITKNASTHSAYIQPTKEEFKQHLISIIDRLPNYQTQDQSVTVYAWNEFGEGGWLLPTRADETTTPNSYPIMGDDGQQEQNETGQPLYYSFHKLDAIKEAKLYWVNKP